MNYYINKLTQKFFIFAFSAMRSMISRIAKINSHTSSKYTVYRNRRHQKENVSPKSKLIH